MGNTSDNTIDTAGIRIRYFAESWNGRPTVFVLHDDSCVITVAQVIKGAQGETSFAEITHVTTPDCRMGSEIDSTEFETLCSEWIWPNGTED